MSPLDQQVTFCTLLKYFHHGDYSIFKKICDMAYGDLPQKNKYFYANIFFTVQLLGLIEFSETERSNQWWCTYQDDWLINSICPKSIGTTTKFFAENRNTVEAIVVDGDRKPLFYGRSSDQILTNSNLAFGNNVLARFPDFKAIEQEILIEEQYRTDLGKHIQAFDETAGRWVDVDLSKYSVPSLVRARGEFTGVFYYVIHPELGLLFRILQFDWAFVAAYKILNWSTNSIVSFEKNTIKIKRTVRFPIMFLRYLFANSHSSVVGNVISFHDIENSSLEDFRKYLNPYEVSNAQQFA